MSIEMQKALADGLLNVLYKISPYVMLAGGAPRDWYFGEEANDLDIYLYSSANTKDTMLKQLKACTGVDFKFNAELMQDDSSLYKHMPQLRHIFEASVEGVKVQVMQLNDPRDEFRVVENMSTSICKIWYQEGKIHLSKDFKLSVATKCMFLKDEYKWTDPHPKKMMERFKGKFTPSTKAHCHELLVNRSLQSLNI